MPNYFLDDQLGKITPASFGVLAYICRRTLGFNRLSSTIPLNQFLKGTYSADGKQLDNGAGIRSKTALVAALKELREKGLIDYKGVRGQDTTYTVILPASTDSILAEEEASINGNTKQVSTVILATPQKSLSKRDKAILRKKVLEKKKDTRSISAPIDFSKFEPGGKYHKMTLPR